MNNNKPLTVFLDSIGRTIIAKVSSETDSLLSVENPALVHIQPPNPATGQLQLQIFPLFFKEFQADKNQPTIWNYKKSNITLTDDIPFAPHFINQYEQIFKPIESTPQKDPEVIKLFDEDGE